MRSRSFSLKVRDAAGWTIVIFGAMALLFGALGLMSPELTLRLMGLQVAERASRAPDDYTITFVIASSMAAFNMGVYYILAALSNFTPFYRWTVPFRCLTCAVFITAALTGAAPMGFIGVGAWEGIGAAATGFALYRGGPSTNVGIE